jgi:thioredoxin 2
MSEVNSATPEVVHVVCPGCHATVRIPSARWADGPRCPRCAATVLGGEPAELDEGEFERHLAHNDVPLVVDFWAPWCGPCRTMAPQFAAAAHGTAAPVQFAKMNVDENPTLANRLGVRSIPTTVLFSGGREVARQAGARAARDIVAWVDAHRE